MDTRSEYQRTIAIGEDAIGHIRKNEVPAYPHSYEVWYSYLSGVNSELVEAVNAIYAKYGRVSSTQLQELHNNFLSKNPAGDKLNQMGDQFAGEVENLMTIVERSGKCTKTLSSALDSASNELSGPMEQSDLMDIVKTLAAQTKEIQKRNNELESQLEKAKDNINNLKVHLEEAREESIMDQLTQIGNRKHFDRSLELGVASHAQSGLPFSMILADIDHFKRFNDTWGHQAGDQVLRLVAHAIKTNVRRTDIACRYGGEEFAVLLPQATLEQATEIAEKIRKMVCRREIVKRSTGENLGRITISAGVATLQSGELGASLVRRSDLCLYAAKDAGRNKVITQKDSDMKDVA